MQEYDCISIDVQEYDAECSTRNAVITMCENSERTKATLFSHELHVLLSGPIVSGYTVLSRTCSLTKKEQKLHCSLTNFMSCY